MCPPGRGKASTTGMNSFCIPLFSSRYCIRVACPFYGPMSITLLRQSAGQVGTSLPGASNDFSVPFSALNPDGYANARTAA